MQVSVPWGAGLHYAKIHFILCHLLVCRTVDLPIGSEAELITAAVNHLLLNILDVIETWIRSKNKPTLAALWDNRTFSQTPCTFGWGGQTDLVLSNQQKYKQLLSITKYITLEYLAVLETGQVKTISFSLQPQSCRKENTTKDFADVIKFQALLS